MNYNKIIKKLVILFKISIINKDLHNILNNYYYNNLLYKINPHINYIYIYKKIMNY